MVPPLHAVFHSTSQILRIPLTQTMVRCQRQFGSVVQNVQISVFIPRLFIWLLYFALVLPPAIWSMNPLGLTTFDL